MGKNGSGWREWVLFNATVFVAAGCIMVVEILSTRLAARYLGSSLYTWTSAIGVVLAGISIGNYVGGRLADRFHARRTICVLFLLASIFCVTIPLMNGWIGGWSALHGLDWPTRILVHFVLVFLLPATMLGTMSPVVAKAALDGGRETGRTIGTVYAWGAIGSIVGTFIAGFLLVAWFGTEETILIVAGVLALTGVLYGYRSWLPYAWTAAYVAVVSSALLVPPVSAAFGLREPNGELIVFDEDSNYQRVVVEITGPDTRKMVLDKLKHSEVNLADPLDLQYGYEAIYADVMRRCHPDGEPLHAMMIGGGGFVFPRYLEISYPGSYIEVSEVDPVVTRAAFETFGVPRNTTIRCFDMDGRNRVDDLIRAKRSGRDVPVFDFVYGDAFSDYSVPYHLTTVEFTRMLHELLSDRGVYLLNLIDSFGSGRFLGAVVHTHRQVFPHVQVVATTDLRSDRNTFVVVSSKRPIGLEGLPYPRLGRPEFERLDGINRNLVLTDDHAPVDNLLAAVVRTYTPGRDEEEAPETAIAAMLGRGEYAAALARCREELRRDPRAPRMHFLLGSALAGLDRPEDAITAYRAELGVDPEFVAAHVRIGRLLERLERNDDALAEYRAALRIDPRDGDARCDLARALGARGDREGALGILREGIALRTGYVRFHVDLAHLLNRMGETRATLEAFEHALRINPDYPGLRHDTAVALLKGGEPERAAALLRQALATHPDDAGLHNQLGRALAAMRDPAGALDAFRRAVELDPSVADHRQNLGIACEQAGRWAEAADQYRACLELDARRLPVMNALAMLLASCPEASVRNGEEALGLARRLREAIGGDHPQALDAYAAALAELGRFEEADAAARQAIRKAEAAGLGNLAAAIRERSALYRSGRPFRR